MAQFEYKVLQMPHNWLDFYTDVFASFGWSVDSLQEVVTGTKTSTQGTTMGTSSTYGSAYIFPPTRYGTRMIGNTYGSNFGVQNSTSSTKVNTALSVTFRRDRENPLCPRLDRLEEECRPHLNAYVARCHKEASHWDWAELQAVSQYRAQAENFAASGGNALPPPGGEISKIWLENNVEFSGQSAFCVHYSLSVKNRKGMAVNVILRLMDENDRLLPDTNNRFTDLRGSVGYTSQKKPGSDSENSSNWLFFPYAELHLKNGKHTIRYQLILVDISTDSVIAESELREFFYNQRGNKMSSFDNDAPDPAIAPQPASFAPSYNKINTGGRQKKASKGSRAAGTVVGVLGVLILAFLFCWLVIPQYTIDPLMEALTGEDALNDSYNHTMWEQQNGNDLTAIWAFVLEDGRVHFGLKGQSYDEIVANSFQYYNGLTITYHFTTDGRFMVYTQDRAVTHHYEKDRIIVGDGEMQTFDDEYGIDAAGIFIRVK